MLVVEQIVCVIPRRSKWAWFRGSLTRAIALRDAVPLLADLGDHEVVLVIACHGEQQLGRSADPGSLEDADLRRVAPHDDRTELLLEPGEAVGTLLDQRQLVAHLEEGPRDVGPDLPAAGDDDVHQVARAGCGVAARAVSRSTEIAVCVGQTVCSPRCA